MTKSVTELFHSPVPHRALEEFLHYVPQYFHIVLAHPDCAGRSGGYLCVRRSTGSRDLPPLVVILVGSAPLGKAAKYCNFAQEKAQRLSDHPDHLSSWQTRDESADQYGGSVRGESLIASFSGLPEHADELLVVQVMLQSGQINYPRAREIAEISDNQMLLDWLANP